MNVVVAIDSFKGSLTSLEAGHAVKDGIRNCMDAQVQVFPLSDGGEGFVESYMHNRKGIKRSIVVHDAMMRCMECSYVIMKDGVTAVMEMACMCGITRIDRKSDDVLYASTYGLGEMIVDAMNQGCRHFVIGIGGSGTNDGGSGVLRALGYELLDEDNNTIPEGAYGLSKLVFIHDEKADKRLPLCTFTIACDVENPLLGINGCSTIFAPQKGADVHMVHEMEQWMTSYADIASHYVCPCDPMVKGAGAAGGLGFAFLNILHAQLVSGITLISENDHLRRWIADCDIVITGEGCLDVQTVMGKAPSGVARLAKAFHKPVIAFAGKLSKDSDLCNAHGIDAFFCIQSGPCTLDEAMNTACARRNLQNTAEQAFRLLRMRLQD